MKRYTILLTGILFTSLLLAQSIEINVKDFGAIPNDSKDDTYAILAAINSSKGKLNPKVIFELGSYDIYANKKDDKGLFTPSMIVDNIQNLTIDGNGAELIGHDFSTMFHFINCKNLAITNLTVDWDPLPFTQGKVVTVDSNFVDIEVLSPFVAKAGLKVEAIIGYDPEKRRMRRNITDHYQLGFQKTTEVIRPGVMRLFVDFKDRFAGSLPTVGSFVIARHHVYGFQSFDFVKCSNLQLENIFIYANPGMGVWGEECRDISIRHLNVMIRPGSGRWMSCTADATHFRACRGKIVMENCLFEGMGDDATNVRSSEYLLVAEILGNNSVKLKKGNKYGDDILPPKVGDKLEVSSIDLPLLTYTTLTVKSVQINEQEKSLTINFWEKLPRKMKEGDIAGDASSCPVLHIRNCTVIRNRSRGFIIKTRNVVIEDCTFQDITECSIALETDVNAWWESIAARDVMIRNNQFINGKFETGYLHGVIEFHTMSKTAPAGVYRKVLIEKNIFLGSAGNMIKIGSADGVDIKNNLMDQSVEEAILLYNSRNIRISGNKLTNSKTALKIADGCDNTTIKSQNNIGF